MSTARLAPLWWDAVDASATRPAISSDVDVDVAIVGAGFTGLWCAYHLAGFDPSLKIAVVEANHVGFGASGRNGGWCHAEYPLGHGQLAHDHGKEAALRQMQALFASVDDVGSIARTEGIDCDYAKGGVVSVARLPFQDAYAREEVEHANSLGVKPDDIVYLSESEAKARLNATNVVSGVWYRHGAAIHPAKLVHGLARAAESRGVEIYESSRATAIRRDGVVTRGGVVSADVTVLATEGFGSQLPGRKRIVLPLYSLMVATEPLSDIMWDDIGLANRETFGDFRNLIIYGQRTADGRLAFGGRGAPYHFGSRIKPSFDTPDDVHTELVRVLVEMFPQLDGVTLTHRWGGALGVSRDWRPSVTFDREAGVAVAGGYVGDGVATAQLAGRTLAELIAGLDTERTTLPWVSHEWPSWEVEPFRWIGINAGLAMARRADRSEERRNRPSKLSDVGNWLRGKRR
ncbi:MAG: FAD-dependent oxidoreductase [Armatimonadetes bacterium]|nr:MAG: FAD-dependent oxidoreductase [Armatimonadota bacterium]